MSEVVTIGDATLYLGDCLEILPTLGRVDHIITDPPYSERTHKGHDAISAPMGGGYGYDQQKNRALGYGAWSPADVDRFAEVATKAADGWIVWMCDDAFAEVIHSALKSRGRYVFAAIPYLAPGSRVRLTGDGPSAWTAWIKVARTSALIKWGTLPGGYVRACGWDAPEKMGGKPLALMAALVRDYSRAGDLVCDPCMGRGTTGVACLQAGRSFIGMERDAAEFDAACERIAAAYAQPRLFAEPQVVPTQEAML